MKLFKTPLPRKACLVNYDGYTEINGELYILKHLCNPNEKAYDRPAIIFGYEYDSNMAETGFTENLVRKALNNMTNPLTIRPSYGGYVNAKGVEIEENGMLLTYDKIICPVSLGSIAHKIAVAFRQPSVLVIYNEEARFINV